MIEAAIWVWALTRWLDVTGPATIITFVLMASAWLWAAGSDFADHDRYWMVWGY